MPIALSDLSNQFVSYYHEGIIYSGNETEKGDLLFLILTETGYQPTRVVFVDDKEDSLKISENAVISLGLPFKGFVYEKTQRDHQDFDSMISTLQLEWLLFKNIILSDAEAAEIKNSLFQNVDPDAYFLELIDRIRDEVITEVPPLL
jgi:hypothetical protein